MDKLNVKFIYKNNYDTFEYYHTFNYFKCYFLRIAGNQQVMDKPPEISESMVYQCRMPSSSNSTVMYTESHALLFIHT